MTAALGRRVRLAVRDADGGRGVIPTGGWPVRDGTLVATIPGPFAGVDGSWPWYRLVLDRALPADFDPLHTRPGPFLKPIESLLLQPEPSLAWREGTPADPIAESLAREAGAPVGVYLEGDPRMPPAQITLADIRVRRVHPLCAGWLTALL